jgi:hypothetical protein
MEHLGGTKAALFFSLIIATIAHISADDGNNDSDVFCRVGRDGIGFVMESFFMVGL